ncbi:MAG: cyclic nucleotide-binding domain-containing protein [Gaiellaceae bacterium]
MRLSRQSKSDLLRAVPLFRGCSRKELAAIARVADEVDLRPGKELTVQGKPAREFFILLSGQAVVRRNGRKLRVLGPGEMIGEIALLNDGPRTATVTLTEPSRVLALTARDFRSLLKDQPDLALKVLATVGARLNSSPSG